MREKTWGLSPRGPLLRYQSACHPFAVPFLCLRSLLCVAACGSAAAAERVQTTQQILGYDGEQRGADHHHSCGEPHAEQNGHHPNAVVPKKHAMRKFQCCVVIRIHRPNVSPCCCNGCCCKTSSRCCFALLIVSTEEAPGNCGGLPQTIPLLELGFVLRAACDDLFLVTTCV